VATPARHTARPLASPGFDRGDERLPFVEVDRNGLEILDRTECLRLLGTAALGRIGITVGALPVVLPVNFRLVGERIVLRAAPGTKLDAATRHAVVAFEVDDIDPFSHLGWSVVVTGMARCVTDPREREALTSSRVPRWAPRGEDCVVAVNSDIITGRRIGVRRLREGGRHDHA
jgi:nitroimidazol reductase NimA-like FMN-containing flavoprotein (pyridoxamine 5'-phosphate oxidase superfamily)